MKYEVMDEDFEPPIVPRGVKRNPIIQAALDNQGRWLEVPYEDEKAVRSLRASVWTRTRNHDEDWSVRTSKQAQSAWIIYRGKRTLTKVPRGAGRA